MKKYLFIILVLFCLFKFDINAKSDSLSDILIIEVGVGESNDLELNNSIKTQGEVDFNKVGTYYLTYYNEKYEYFFERTVKIVEKEEIYGGVNYYEDIENLDKKYKINDIAYITNDEYFVVGEIDSGDDIIQTIFIQKYGFVRYYDKNKLVWEHVFDNTYSYVSSCEVSNAGVLLSLSYEKAKDDSEVMIVEMTKNNNIIRSMSFGGNEIEFVDNLKLVDNKILCFLSSYSSSGEISYMYDNTRFLAFVVIGYDDFLIKNKKMYGNDKYNIILDIDYHPDYKCFYLLIRTSGTKGPLITNQNKYVGDFLVKLSLDLEITNVKHLDTMYASNNFITIARDKIMVCSNVTYERSLMFSYYSFNLDYEGFYKYTLNNNILLPFKIRSFAHDDILIGLNIVNSDDTIDSAILNVLDEDSSLNILDDLGRLSKANVSNEASILVTDNNRVLKFINIDSSVMSKVNYNFKDYFKRYIYINNNFVGTTGLNKQEEKFGEYFYKSYFNEENISLILKSEYYEPFYSNIKNNELYDVFTEILFNGDGLLNDVEFSSGERILNPGKYELVVKGENDRKILYFEVKELSLPLKDKEEIELNIKEVNPSKTNYSKENAINLELNFNDVATPVILYFILIISFFIIVSFLIPLKFKKFRRKK